MDKKINDSYLQEKIKDYLTECKNRKLYDWRYYYIAYPGFRPGRYGKYAVEEDKPYALVALYTQKRESNNAYQCMLQALIDEHAVEESTCLMNTRTLNCDDSQLTCENNAFVSYSLDGDKVQFRIPQNDEGIDTVDRIQYFKEHREDNNYWTPAEENNVGV